MTEKTSEIEPSAYELAEYERLCSEISTRLSLDMELLDRLFQAAGFSATLAGLLLTVGGTWISLGVQLLGASIALFCCPVVLAFLAGMQSDNDLRRGQIVWHLRTRHEERYMPDGWESRRKVVFNARPWVVLRKQDRAKYHKLAPLRGAKVLSMRGLFVTVQVLFLGAGTTCGYVGAQHMQNVPLLIGFVGALFVIALMLTLFTCFTIQHRREVVPSVLPKDLDVDTDQLGEIDLEEEHPFAPCSRQESES